MPLSPRRRIGRCETGIVYEQAVEVPLEEVAGGVLRLRRIELELDTPTEDGDTLLRLLTTPPGRVSACRIAGLYRRRWSIEGMFQRLEAALMSAIRTLGQPRAALLAFSVAVLAYNVLATVEAALAAEAAARATAEGAEPVPISTYYVAHEVRESYRGHHRGDRLRLDALRRPGAGGARAHAPHARWTRAAQRVPEASEATNTEAAKRATFYARTCNGRSPPLASTIRDIRHLERGGRQARSDQALLRVLRRISTRSSR